ncbi:MAG: amino acid deaminase [bacterium]|nr:amino acid deaminase [bacterium]
MFPVATISESDLQHNIATMASFCADIGLSLAPHGKTSMSPEVTERQLDAGAWGITASTASQAQVFRSFGVTRLLIAHQVVDPAAIRWIWDETTAHADVRIVFLIDSIAGVDRVEAALCGRPPARPLDVLVELGAAAGRTGCRSIDEAIDVARRVDASERLRLVGVEGYEGILPAEGGDFSTVDGFLEDVRTLARRLNDLGLFVHLDEVIVTAGGSMYPDRVAVVLGDDWDLGRPVRVVIRSGGYVTHDSIHYAKGGPFRVRPPLDAYPALRPALTVWSYVVSRPEPDLVLLGFGKRDASFDLDLPVPLTVRRGDELHQLDGALELLELNDQHAYVGVPRTFDLAVGDIIGCGISHPCTTLDRWRALPLVDEEFNVTGVVRTFF